MSRSNILLANARRVASESRTRGSDVEHYQHTAPVHVGAGPRYAGRHLRNAGSEELNVNGSVTPVVFALLAGAAEVLRVYRLRLVLQLGTAATWTTFGNITALTNGLTLKLVDALGADVVDLLDGEPIKSNADLATLGDVEGGTLGATYLLTASIGLAMPVRIDSGEALRLTVADNLAGLTRARLRVDAYDEGTLR